MTDYLKVLRAIAPRGKPAIVKAVASAFEEHFPAYGINTPLRIAHFLAQAAHESDGFHTLEEYASGKAYEGRKDLGNVKPGDGVRFKGRGIYQCTGRTNYQAYGRKLGVDLIAHPEQAAEAELSVRIACEYWKAKGLNGWADRDDVKEITRRINGGSNGLSDRKKYLAKARAALRPDDEPVRAPPPEEEVPDAPIAAERGKTGVTEGGLVATATTATDTLSTANDVITKVNETKESAESLGLTDHLAALATNPRFLISAAVLIALIGGLIWWQIHKRR